MSEAEIGVIAGSGFYSLFSSSLENEEEVETPFGKPSDKIVLGKIGGRQVAFLPRHGRKHEIPPHKINYCANILAFKQLGVQRIISIAAVGSLQKGIDPGDFLVPDQFIDRTSGRRDTFYDGSPVTHIAGAEPFCSALRKQAVETGRGLEIKVHDGGTIVVIQGPRFSTKAESHWFKRMGWHAVSMTQYPEVVLAREQEICYASIALVTDYDVGLAEEPTIRQVTASEVGRVLRENNEKAKKLVEEMIPRIPRERDCVCANALEHARL